MKCTVLPKKKEDNQLTLRCSSGHEYTGYTPGTRCPICATSVAQADGAEDPFDLTNSIIEAELVASALDSPPFDPTPEPDFSGFDGGDSGGAGSSSDY